MAHTQPSRWGRRLAPLGLSLLLALPAGAAELPGPRADDEPNDDVEHATWLDLPVVDAAGCIDPAGEADFYQFSLERAGSLVVGIRDVPAPGPGTMPLLGAAFSLELFDETQAVLGRGIDQLELPLLAAGTYWLKITHVQKACYLLNIYAGSR